MKVSINVVEQKSVFHNYHERASVNSVLTFVVPRRQNDFQFKILAHLICGDGEKESNGIHQTTIYINLSYESSYKPSNQLVVETSKVDIWKSITTNKNSEIPLWIRNVKFTDINVREVSSDSDNDWENRLSKFLAN